MRLFCSMKFVTRNYSKIMQAREYRSDIGVLRAIAVLSVIFYHAHIPYFGGGYVGVSIFFVISGYLVTGIIKRKLENGTFSFLEFYENRVRRIFSLLLFALKLYKRNNAKTSAFLFALSVLSIVSSAVFGLYNQKVTF